MTDCERCMFDVCRFMSFVKTRQLNRDNDMTHRTVSTAAGATCYCDHCFISTLV